MDIIPIKDIADSIKNVIDDINPYRVFTSSNKDLNSDHQIVHDATLIACRPFNALKSQVYAYESFESCGVNGSEQFSPNCFCAINWELKQEAIKTYESQMKSPPHPRSIRTLESLAILRGSQCGENYAEGFETIRKML
jgi:LmbE family N-acetylglucosaminyl deacetylase